MADLHSDTAEAIRLMEAAAETARLSGALPESRAWFEYQVGYLHLKSGDPDTALDWFERADELLPGYYLAQAGMARATAAQGDLATASTHYQELIAAVPQPDYLAALGDLYTLQGDAAAADEQYATVEFIAELGAGAYDRQFTLYLLNHDLRLEEALAAARQDVAQRQDVYAWDTLAWALYKQGRHAEAADAMARALAPGTVDAQLHYHAGMIQAALGDTVGARHHLERALEINPAFDPLQAGLAQAALAELP
jgi:tetratricopeptide (TPR) repeat protein